MPRKHYPFCRIEFRTCVLCPVVFLTFPQVRKKYCSDRCAAQSIIDRPGNRYTLDGALAHLKAQREIRKERRSERRNEQPSPPMPETSRNPIQNRHTPGSIAFMLLYGMGAFSFNMSDGEDRVGRGASSARARQVGGPNI